MNEAEDGDVKAGGPSVPSAMFKKRKGIRDKAGGTIRARQRILEDESASIEQAEEGGGTRKQAEEAFSLEDLIALRAQRNGGKGIDLERLNKGDGSVKKRKKEGSPSKSKDVTREERWDEQMRRGGLITHQHSKDTAQDDKSSDEDGDEERDKSQKDAVRLVNRNNFQGETGTVDVDKHMLAYIEAEMRKRRQGQDADDDAAKPAGEDANSAEDGLYRIEEKYRQIQQAAKDAIALERSRVNAGAAEWKGVRGEAQTGQMDDKDREEGNVALSTAMLTGVPEVDLGIDFRLKNIEATERARRKLEQERAMATTGLGQERQGVDDEVASVRFFRHRVRAQPDVQRQDDDAGGLQGSAQYTGPAQPMAAAPDGGARRKYQTATDDAALEHFKKRQRNQLKR